MLFVVFYLLLRRLVGLAGVKGAFIPIVAMTRGFPLTPFG